jgi:hypothetical protein
MFVYIEKFLFTFRYHHLAPNTSKIFYLFLQMRILSCAMIAAVYCRWQMLAVTLMVLSSLSLLMLLRTLTGLFFTSLYIVYCIVLIFLIDKDFFLVQFVVEKSDLHHLL